MKIIFNFDYSPRKKNESFEPTNIEEQKVADWYVANGIARKCCQGKDPKDCGCGKEKSVEILPISENETIEKKKK